MTLDRMQDRIQYRPHGGVWTTESSAAAQADASESSFAGTLTQAQSAGATRADALDAQTEQALEAEEDTRTLREKMQDIIDMLNEKVRNGETAPSFRIGAQSFTIEEWDRMIEQIDAVQEEVREQQRAKHGERLKEEAQKSAADADWMDNRYAEDGVIRKDDDTLTIEEQLERILMDMDDPDAEAAAARRKMEENARQETAKNTVQQEPDRHMEQELYEVL